METKERITLWMPRILCIGAILFVSFFALDSFESGIPLGQQLLAFMMHLIPSFVLLLMLLLAWKRPFIGGIVFALTGIITSPLVYNLNYNRNHSVGASLMIIMLITIPFIVVGILFILNHFVSKHSKK
jgi:hypothetical protein